MLGDNAIIDDPDLHDHVANGLYAAEFAGRWRYDSTAFDLHTEMGLATGSMLTACHHPVGLACQMAMDKPDRRKKAHLC